ncbi:MAG: MarR family transcriptional regulator [Clostridiales bacterium]|nr:MarR family transcriptional regulator [Clostridiales bacterium]
MTSELYEKLTQLQWLLNKQQIRAWAVNGPMADTTRGQGRILAVLKLRDGISTKDLSYLLGLSISSLNELLSKMEKGGYVTREPSAQDKRVMLVKLTEKGRCERQPETSDFNDVFSCLSDEEQNVFSEYLDRIIAALHERFGAQGDEMLEKVAALRERFGNMGGFFGGRGFPHGMHTGFGPDRSYRRDGDER